MLSDGNALWCEWKAAIALNSSPRMQHEHRPVLPELNFSPYRFPMSKSVSQSFECFAIAFAICAMLSGCQKLPPGVLAGSREQSTAVTASLPSTDASSRFTDGSAATDKLEIDELANARAEIDRLRSERDQLRDDLVATQLRVIESQQELVALLRRAVDDRDEQIAAIAKPHVERTAEIRVAEEPTTESSPASVQ